MTENETDIVLEKLATHLNTLDKLIHWQRAAITGLREFVIESGELDREEAMQRISTLTRQSYDKAMLELGERESAAYVKQIDIREDFPDDSVFWRAP